MNLLNVFRSSRDDHSRQPTPREDELLQYYHYPAATTLMRNQKIGDYRSFAVYRIEIAPPAASRYAPRKVGFDYYQVARPGKSPVVLMSPLLGKDDIVAKSFARTFACHRLHCALIHREKEAITSIDDLDKLEAYFWNAVTTIRHTVDWLVSREEVDPEHLGTLGISFGAVKNAIAAGVEERLKCHVLALAGGGLADIVCYSNRREIRHWRDRMCNKYGLTLSQLHQTLVEKLRSDPILLAEHVDPRQILMFIARFDRVVPRGCAERLWQALGKPEAIWLPCGHYAAGLVLPSSRKASLQFFKKCLGREQDSDSKL